MIRPTIGGRSGVLRLFLSLFGVPHITINICASPFPVQFLWYLKAPMWLIVGSYERVTDCWLVNIEHFNLYLLLILFCSHWNIELHSFMNIRLLSLEYRAAFIHKYQIDNNWLLHCIQTWMSNTKHAWDLISILCSANFLFSFSDIPPDIDSVNISIFNKEKMSKDKEVCK